MNRRVFLGACAILLVACSLAEARKWTDVAGNQISAEYVRIHEGEVILSQGSRLIRCPYDQFSEEDKAYIRQQMDADRNKAQRRAGVNQISGPVAPEETDGDARELRTWQDQQGNKILAQYTGFTGGRIELLKEGRRVSYRYELFSPPDQFYVAQILISEGRADEIPKKEEEKGEGRESQGPGSQESHEPGSMERGSVPGVPDYEVITPPGISMPESRESEHAASPGSRRGGGPVINHVPLEHVRPPMPQVPSYSSPSSFYQEGCYCSKCKGQLSASIKAGDSCPHCGAFLSFVEGPNGTKTYASPFSFRNTRFVIRVGVLGFFLLMGLLGALARAFR